MSLARILDLRKKTDADYAQDKRDKMSDEDGKQVSIEEVVQKAEPKKTRSSRRAEAAKVAPEEKSAAGKKARATTKGKKGKQLTLEDTLDE